jgi:hypothetical protein
MESVISVECDVATPHFIQSNNENKQITRSKIEN